VLGRLLSAADKFRGIKSSFETARSKFYIFTSLPLSFQNDLQLTNEYRCLTRGSSATPGCPCGLQSLNHNPTTGLSSAALETHDLSAPGSSNTTVRILFTAEVAKNRRLFLLVFVHCERPHLWSLERGRGARFRSRVFPDCKGTALLLC
jgi:hypothetical protein